jgi:hypothetical protein
MRLSDISGVKVLGRAIGAARSVKPSDFDGDGDGFVMGPDGRDNVPAPKRVVDAAKKARRVADVLKPTDDLLEVRKSGRPWKPLLIDELPDDMKKDLHGLFDDVAKRMHEKGAAWRKIEDDLIRKYAKPGEPVSGDGKIRAEIFARVPREELEKHAVFLNQYLIDSDDTDKKLAARVNAWDTKYRDFLKSEFAKSREKAVAGGMNPMDFDKKFSKFNKALNEQGPSYRFSVAGMLTGVVLGADTQLAVRAYRDGYGGQKLVTNQFSNADGEAKKLMDNPDKRIVSFIDAGMLDGILSEGRMRNFFEAKRNVFNDDFKNMEAYDKYGARERKANYLEGRVLGEERIFGLPEGVAQPKHRPIYALLMPDGLRAVNSEEFTYGNVGLVMKHSVEERSKFTGGDSLNFRFHGASPINDPSAVAMISRSANMSAEDRRASAKDGNPLTNNWYVEAQVMGGVSVGDISYVTVADETVLSDEIKTRLKDMGIPVVVHSSSDVYEEPAELAAKAETKADAYVLFATYGNRKLFVPSGKPKDDDYHGMVSLANGKRRRVDNVMSLMKFGNWELV